VKKWRFSNRFWKREFNRKKEAARANSPMTETEDTKPTDDGEQRDQRTANRDDRDKQQQQQKPIPPLHVAARTGDLDALSKLLASADKLERSLNERDFHGRTALHLAAWANQKDAVERLLDVGADVSVGAADGVQAIHFACMKGYLGMCFMCARVFSNFADLSLCIFIIRYRQSAALARANESRERSSENEQERKLHALRV